MGFICWRASAVPPAASAASAGWEIPPGFCFFVPRFIRSVATGRKMIRAVKRARALGCIKMQVSGRSGPRFRLRLRLRAHPAAGPARRSFCRPASPASHFCVLKQMSRIFSLPFHPSTGQGPSLFLQEGAGHLDTWISVSITPQAVLVAAAATKRCSCQRIKKRLVLRCQVFHGAEAKFVRDYRWNLNPAHLLLCISSYVFYAPSWSFSKETLNTHNFIPFWNVALATPLQRALDGNECRCVWLLRWA